MTKKQLYKRALAILGRRTTKKQSRSWLEDKGDFVQAKKTIVQIQDSAKKLMAAMRALEKKAKAGPNSEGDIVAMSKVENMLFRAHKEMLGNVAHVKEVTKHINTGTFDRLA